MAAVVTDGHKASNAYIKYQASAKIQVFVENLWIVFNDDCYSTGSVRRARETLLGA